MQYGIFEASAAPELLFASNSNYPTIPNSEIPKIILKVKFFQANLFESAYWRNLIGVSSQESVVGARHPKFLINE
jgi:hypothetical protein